MKAISLTQPWATLIAIGAKRIETRSWSTSYRGQIAIHAAKGFPRDCQDLCRTVPFAHTLIVGGVDRVEQLPRGAIVAVAMLTGTARTEDITAMSQGLLRHEIEFGDYAPGRFGFVLADVVALRSPILCKGALGLWTVPTDVVDLIEHATVARSS